MTADVLLAHESPVTVGIARHILTAEGYRVDVARDGHRARERIEVGAYAALVIDVLLPGIPGYALVSENARIRGLGAGAGVVVLVSSVFRVSSYRRPPRSLYGADAHIEAPALGAEIVPLLRRLGVMPTGPADPKGGNNVVRGVVADIVLFHGAALFESSGESACRAIVEDELGVARACLDPKSAHLKASGSVDDAFRDVMRALGRETEVHS